MSEPMSAPANEPGHESSDEDVEQHTAPETESVESGSSIEAPEAPEDVVDTDEVATATEPVDEGAGASDVVPELDDTPDTPEAVDLVDTVDSGESGDSGEVADVDDAGDAGDAGDAEEDDEDEGDDEDRPSRRARLEQEGEIAADYLEELLEIADLDGDLDMDVEGDRATVSIVGAELPQLVGDQGEVLEALQELTRLAVYRETGERSRLMLDVSGHRADRRTALEQQAADVVARVKESGEQAALEPMSPFERKVVHDVVAAAGLKSESEGAEPRRYVVVLPG